MREKFTPTARFHVHASIPYYCPTSDSGAIPNNISLNALANNKQSRGPSRLKSSLLEPANQQNRQTRDQPGTPRPVHDPAARVAVVAVVVVVLETQQRSQLGFVTHWKYASLFLSPIREQSHSPPGEQ